jgi:hypothetical protein
MLSPLLQGCQMHSLVVFSHLRWNFVYQRPQHLLSRMASRWPVFFIEEPILGAPSDRIEFITSAPGVEVWRPHLREADAGQELPIQAAMQRLLGISPA